MVLGGHLCDPVVGKNVLNRTHMLPQHRGNNDTLNYNKIKNFCSSKDIIKKVKNNPQNWGSYLQYIYLTKDQYPEFLKNS